MLTALTATMIALALLTPAAPSQKKSGEGILFTPSYEKAFQEATERGVPLMILIVEDDEEANEDCWANTYNAPEFVRATRRTVNVIANRGTQEAHGVIETTVNKRPKRLCAKFGSITCADHNKSAVGMFRDFAREGQVKTPQVLLVLPDQTIVASHIDRTPMPELLGAFAKAERKLPNGLDQDEAAALRQGLLDARVWMEEKNYPKVVQFALPYQKRDTSANLVANVRHLMDKVEKAGKTELNQVQANLEAKEYVAAVEQLEAMAARYRRTPIEAVVKEQRTRLKKNREVKAALTKAKREVAARKLLENADTLLEKGQDSRAEKLYERIRERFGNTEAASELAKRGQ